MKKRYMTALLAVSAMIMASALSTQAVNIDLSGATTGTLITAPGGSFAQSFVGQTIAGVSLTGSPTDPLTLQPGGTLNVAFFNGFNTILSQPGNAAPLALLLDQPADSITWTMGYTDNPGGTLTIDFFDSNGTIVNSVNQALLVGYDTYNFSGLGTFYGLAIYNNNDPAGLRFYDFQYNAVVQGVPDAGSSLLLLGLAAIGLAGLRRKA